MPRSEHKRQKQLAKKNKRAQQVRKTLQKARNLSTLDIVLECGRMPIDSVFQYGNDSMKVFTLIRRRPNGEWVTASLQIDMYCLGVKDAYVRRFIEPSRLRELIFERNGSEAEPAYALKCILGSIEFAKKFGLNPHPETETVLLMFAGVDPKDCTEEFEYGRNGKPLFIQGPYDDSAKAYQIMQTVEEATGEPVPFIHNFGGIDASHQFLNPNLERLMEEAEEFEDGEDFDDEYDSDVIDGTVIDEKP